MFKTCVENSLFSTNSTTKEDCEYISMEKYEYKSFFMMLSIKDNKLKDKLLSISNEVVVDELHISIQCTHTPLSEAMQKEISNITIQPISINGCMVFNQGEDDSYLVLSVDCPQFHKYWDKPDFPVSVYGYNTHITLYNGNLNKCIDMSKLYDDFTYTIQPENIEIMFEINTKSKD